MQIINVREKGLKKIGEFKIFYTATDKYWIREKPLFCIPLCQLLSMIN